MLAIASWSAAGDTRNKPRVWQAEFEDEEYREGDAEGSRRKGGNDQFVGLSKQAHAEEQDDRPGHDHDHQAGADSMTGELQVREDAAVVYCGQRAGVIGNRLPSAPLWSAKAARRALASIRSR